MKLVFFGSSENSAEVLKFIISKKYNINIVVTRKRKPQGRGLKLISNLVEDVANENEIKLLDRTGKKARKMKAMINKYSFVSIRS